jgi:hypothetical protein
MYKKGFIQHNVTAAYQFSPPENLKVGIVAGTTFTGRER